MAFFAAPLLQVFCVALRLRSVSTTAVFSAIRCRCGMAFIAASFPQAFCAALPFRPVSITAAFSAIRCRCGMFISACALAAGLLRGIAPPSRFHNGSVFRDSVPLRHGFHRGILSTGLLRGIALPSRFHNGSVFRDSVPLRHGFFRCALAAGLLRGIAPPSRFHNGSVFRDSVPLRYHALEGADRSGISPPPSRIRYNKPTCPRSVPRRPCPGTPSGRCRRKCCLPVTFSFGYVASLHSFGKGNVYVALCASPVSIPVFCFLESAG